MARVTNQFEKRKERIRLKLKRNNKSLRIRMSVFRSNKNIYVQLIDDIKGMTIASASTRDVDLAKRIKKASTIDAAKQVGVEIANKAKKLNVSHVVFDKGGYEYHGRIKALADAARETTYLTF